MRKASRNRLLGTFLALLLCAPTLASAQNPGFRPPYTGSPVPAELVRDELSHARAARPEELRQTMLRLIGPLPASTPLNPVVLGQTSLPGMRIEKVLFDSQPGFHVTALLYLPDATLVSGLLPAIVMAPGHSPAGKAGDFALASAFTRNGFAVLSYDPLGQGERLQYPNPKDPAHTLTKGPTGEHGEASLQPVLLGESIAKYFLWDGMRAIDYLETRPEIDPNRLGAFGCSGGGAMTALLGAVDPRVAAIGTACYLTTWDALLTSIGPQDGEQSTPGWIAAGLDFAAYVEAAAPRSYAIIATEADMFPFAGAVETEAEARRFYRGYGADKQLAFINGPGGHGNLKPILPRILRFYIDALHPALNTPIYDDQSPAMQAPPGALQVTSTGQVSTFDVNAETVFTLNRKHAESVHMGHPATLPDLRQAIEQVVYPKINATYTHRIPSRPSHALDFRNPSPRLPVADAQSTVPVRIPRLDRTYLNAELSTPASAGPHALALLLVTPGQEHEQESSARLRALLASGHIVLTLSPEPTSPGNADVKASQLGPWYLPGLSAELTGQSILGLRLADTRLALDYLSKVEAPHTPGIVAEASGHLALVLLHAAVLDPDPTPGSAPRITRILLHNLPPTYAQLLATPIPLDAPEDILPGVLLHYDIPDLIAALGSRVAILP